ncbi:hypothetical protein JS278_01794 [Acidipropionibacterium virtanenii]|uniref:Uncharacterized protein n=1 Tax=Acidipropionibacterium virtanenii TaxID=2057246 RepID=A0A344UUK5_9ACTN|nr:hypothetical protein JS278_01794 [Acidipropionibacterium virtanenii]
MDARAIAVLSGRSLRTDGAAGIDRNEEDGHVH